MARKKWSELKSRMSPEMRAEIEAGAREVLATMPLAEIRKAVGLTQAEIAQHLDVGQGSVSKIENATDMYLTTLRKYVEALGGELELTVSFPDGRRMIIDSISGVAQAPTAPARR